MSQLEERRAKPAMERLILSDQNTEVSPDELNSIAAFGFKTAVLADHMKPSKQFLFSETIRHDFAATLRIPAAVNISLGCFSAESLSGTFRPNYAKIPSFSGNSHDFYTFTFAIGRMFVQVTAVRAPDASLIRHSIKDQRWDSIAIPIWPLRDTPVAWPPGRCLSPDLLEVFSSRFDVHMLILK